VTGQTIVIPLVGHPVSQVKSPGPMNRWFDDQGIDAVVIPMDIRPEKVEAFFEVVRAMENCAGCSITMPHKQVAFVASDEVSERARRAKAVNTIRRTATGRLIGDMTDGLAFVSSLKGKGVDVAGRNVLLVGAGAAGTAIAFELATEKAAAIVVLETDQLRQRGLISELQRYHPDVVVHPRVPEDFHIDIAINASPVGMDEADPLPYPIDSLGGALIVADAVTKPAMTPWLKAAEQSGLPIQTEQRDATTLLADGQAAPGRDGRHP
jgi:shikimate dehydrogenase